MKYINIGHLYSPPITSYSYLIRLFKYFALDPDKTNIDDFLILLENSKKTKRILYLISKLKELKTN